MSISELAKAFAGPAPKRHETPRQKEISQKDEAARKRLDRARRASSSINTVSGGGYAAPASDAKNSLRDEIRGAMER